MKRLLLSLMLLALAACSSNPRVTNDFSPDVDFGAIKTYSWLVPPQGVSPLVQSRIVSSVDQQLQAKAVGGRLGPGVAKVGNGKTPHPVIHPGLDGVPPPLNAFKVRCRRR
jgi:hypothetical protein